MTDEDRLRERLREQVAQVPVTANLDDVAARIGHPRRGRGRPLAVLAVVTLVVVALGGYAIGRGRHGNIQSVSVGGASATATSVAPTASSVPTTTAPTTSEPDPSTVATLPPTSVTTPTQGLPGPGAVQPSDPVEARAALAQTFADAFEGSAPDPAKAQAIEGGSGLVGVFDQIRQGHFARQVEEAKAEIDGVVFESATNAVVKFHSDLGADGTSGPFFADADLGATGWQVSYESYCRIIIPTGVHCP